MANRNYFDVFPNYFRMKDKKLFIYPWNLRLQLVLYLNTFGILVTLLIRKGAENNIGLRFSLKNGALTQRVPKGIHK